MPVLCEYFDSARDASGALVLIVSVIVILFILLVKLKYFGLNNKKANYTELFLFLLLFANLLVGSFVWVPIWENSCL